MLNCFFTGYQTIPLYHLPRRARNPLAVQTTRLNPTDPVLCRTLLGEMNIPEPKNKINTSKHLKQTLQFQTLDLVMFLCFFSFILLNTYSVKLVFYYFRTIIYYLFVAMK